MDPDHDTIIELKARVGRIESDIESEKGTRSRANERIHTELGNIKAHVDLRCDAIAKQGSSWYERVFWLIAGATVSALTSWVLKR